MEDEFTKVARLVPAGPAAKHGELKPADRIVAVGEGDKGEMKDVVGWRLDDVVDLIRGPKGSLVRLEVIPVGAKSEEERRTIAITRNEVKLEEQSAQKRVIEIDNGGSKTKIGVIDLPAFYIDFEAMRRGDPEFKSTTRDVQKLLSELMAENVQGVVIDLRENGGGSLQEANALTGLFIDSGPTVQIRHSSARVFKEGKPRSGPYYDGPLAVLINRLSASASEIFAGAIQDYQRGIILGDQSFGKGTVQSLTPLQYGELKLTESKFYRISGDSTQNRGIVPDVPFPTLYDPTEVGESALDKALPWDRIPPVRHQVYFDIRAALPQLVTHHQQRVKKDPDFVYLQAQLAMAEEQRKQRRLSLNEEVRKLERTQEKTRALAIENQRRSAKGQEPLKELADAPVEDLADPIDAGAAAAEEEDAEQQPDPLLTEAAHVLVDALPIYRQPSYAYRNY
jgi:carboxyl-terminal processing protease